MMMETRVVKEGAGPGSIPPFMVYLDLNAILSISSTLIIPSVIIMMSPVLFMMISVAIIVAMMRMMRMSVM